MPPARWTSSNRCSPDGRTFASSGVRRESSSKRSSVSGTPARPASASRWMTAFVAAAERHQQRDRVVERSAVTIRDGRRSSRASSTARRPVASAAAARPRSTAGIAAVPGSDIPSASTSAAIVEAVPSSLQWPAPWIVAGLELVELRLGHPAGAHLLDVVPEVGAGAELAAAEDAGSAGPAVSMIAGTSALARAHQLRRARSCRSPPSSTTASSGKARIALLDVHRHEVAEEHRRRLHQVLAERDRRELERQPAGRRHAALAPPRRARAGAGCSVTSSDQQLQIPTTGRPSSRRAESSPA